MDAFKLLEADHEKVSQLFKQIESASGAAKRELFTRLKAELDVHAHIEEKVLYPALENTEEAREITLEAYEEHKVVKELLAELAGGRRINDEWDAKFTVLKENVEHHVEEEEGELFNKARKALSDQEIDRIGAELEAEKTFAQGAPRTTSRDAKSLKRSSKKVASRSTVAATGATRSGKRASKHESQSESPGVLKRIANFIGLRDSSTSKPNGKKASKGKSASKSPSSKATAGAKAAKRSPAKTKAAAKASVKAPAKRSSSKKAGRTRATVGAETSRANKRQTASGGKSATTGASRSSSKKRARSTSTKRKQTG